MNKLINVNIRNENGKLLVSSRDIAKGLEKEHKDVLRKIREVLNEREFSPVEYIDEKGEIRPEYMLDKNAFILLVMNYTGYNDFKRAYIKRFDEMEKRLSVNIPQSFPEALRCLAAEVEQRELMQKQCDEGAGPHWPSRERKKAQAKKLQSCAGSRVRNKGSFASFSSSKKREAMNTASQKSKEAEKLKIKLDLEMAYATVKKVERATGRKYSWKNLKKYCESAGIGWNKAFDANYVSVNSYPAEAWKNVYGVEL